MNTEPNTRQKNLAGNLLGIGCLLILVVALAGIFYPFVGTHRGSGSPTTSCLLNLKQVGTAMNMYTSDWGDAQPRLHTPWPRVPKGKAWIDRFMVYAKNKRIAYCPENPDRLTYSFNRNLSGLRESEITHLEDTAAVFESVNDSPRNNNLNGDIVIHPAKDRLPSPGCYIVWSAETRKMARRWPDWAKPSHTEATNVLYADGHAKTIYWGWDASAARYIPRLAPK